MYIILNLQCTSNFLSLCFILFFGCFFFVFFKPASCASRGRPLFEPRLLYEDLWRTRARWPCRPPHCRLRGTSHNSDNKSRRGVYCDRLQKLEQVSSLCRLALCAHIPTFTHTHTHTHTGIRHPHTDLSCLIRFLSFLPVWIWINRRKLSTGWIQRHAPPSSSSSSLSPFPPSLSLSLSLYRSAVCRCAAVCNRFFSAALQPEASTGLSGRKSITAGLSLACGGAYGREIRT